MSEPLGSTIDALGVTHSPDDGELIASAIVLMRVIGADGEESIRFAYSEGLGWVERIGMLRVAEKIELDTTGTAADED